MKLFRLFPLLVFFVLASCSSVQVNTDYDKSVDFTQYKTFAFYRQGVDKVQIHDLDKKRILKAIQNQMQEKGFSISENPDVLVNIFTKERENVDVDNFGVGYGFGFGPFGFSTTRSRVSRTTEGSLYIDIIDARTNEMIWQGVGSGVLTQNMEEKEERINEFVAKILQKFPPQSK